MASLSTTITVGLDDEGRALLEQLQRFPAGELRAVLNFFSAGGLATDPLVRSVEVDRDRLLVELKQRDQAIAAAAKEARARAFQDAARWCERHAGDATLDRTGVERKTLLRASKLIAELE